VVKALPPVKALIFAAGVNTETTSSGINEKVNVDPIAEQFSNNGAMMAIHNLNVVNSSIMGNNLVSGVVPNLKDNEKMMLTGPSVDNQVQKEDVADEGGDLKKRKRIAEGHITLAADTFYWDRAGEFCFGDPKSSIGSTNVFVNNNPVYEDDNESAEPAQQVCREP
jgi:hypothetical protein